MSSRQYKLWISGSWSDGNSHQDIRSPYSHETVARMPQCDAQQIESVLQSAHTAYESFRKVSRYARSRLLTGIAQKISERKNEIVERIIQEAGKPRATAEVEVGRAVSTFTIAAEEVKRFGGEIVPVDLDASSRSYYPARTYWFPRGPVLAITPFNFPLNLAVHKVAPAFAVGAPVVLKPPPQAPGAALLLAEIFEQVANEISDVQEKIPMAALQVLSAPNELLEKLVTDPRLAILSFTGSDKVGWMLQTKAVRKKVALELGGNAALVIHSDADLARAATRAANGGFSYAGQVCISVQRILVQKNVAPEFQKLFLDEVKKLKVGDPEDKDTVVGPLIDQHASDRLAEWIKESVDDGAKILLGGSRDKQMMAPTVLTGVKHSHKLNTEEAFGPVVTIETYNEFEDALKLVNDSRFGLQAGIFTDSTTNIEKAIQILDVGGVIINDIPTFRADIMPYGGAKDSGLGREGLKYAMQDYCELKTVVQWKGN